MSSLKSRQPIFEVLVNAICHRDYEAPGSSIHLAIYDDRVEMTSSGGLMPGIEASDLKKPHKSILRNSLIAQIFYYVGYVEQWGQGTLKIARLCTDYGLPEPKFIEHALWFEISFKIPTKSRLAPRDIPSSKTRQEKILNLLTSHNQLTIKEIEDLLFFKNRRMLQRDLQALKLKKMVETSFKGPSTTWILSKEL